MSVVSVTLFPEDHAHRAAVLSSFSGRFTGRLCGREARTGWASTDRPALSALFVQEAAMALLLVTDDSTRAEIAEAIEHLRTRQRAAVIPSTAAEIGVEIDALLDQWRRAGA